MKALLLCLLLLAHCSLEEKDLLASPNMDMRLACLENPTTYDCNHTVKERPPQDPPRPQSLKQVRR